jgi:hypothetical protein
MSSLRSSMGTFFFLRRTDALYVFEICTCMSFSRCLSHAKINARVQFADHFYIYTNVQVTPVIQKFRVIITGD